MRIFFKKIFRLLIVRLKFPNAKISSSAIISLDTILANKGVHILQHSRIGSCKIGRYTYIAANCTFERTEIGSFVSIGSDVICGMAKHPLNYISTYPGFYSDKASGSEWFGYNHDFAEHQPVIIGSDVWIGARSTILGGIKVGNGAVIGAGSVVTKDVPAHAVVAGVPARVIRYRFDEELSKKILDAKWWEASDVLLKKSAKYAQNPNDFIDYLSGLTCEKQD